MDWMGHKGSWIVLVVAMGMAQIGWSEKVTFEKLLTEMTNLEALSQSPRPRYVCKQFSSYDRRSTDPSVQTEKNWFANVDRGKFLRDEKRNGNTEWVMADMKGPGAIVRIWSANADDAGVLRIYLDHGETPVIEMPMRDMLDGKHAPFLEPLSGVHSKGWNAYYPIPYAKHCKVTTSKAGFYYHVNYRTYRRGTRVETYDPNAAERLSGLLDQTRARLAHPAQLVLTENAKTRSYEEELASGASLEVSMEGPAAIREITCLPKGDDLDIGLRQCVMEIFFDGMKDPLVQAPLGDFFGTAPGVNPFQSLPCGVTTEGSLYSHWVMPFKEQARIKITNLGRARIRLSGHAIAVPGEWDRRSLYFHCKWVAGWDIPTRPMRDWQYLLVKGKGQFVGDMLHVTNPSERWWGEGDEKIYVDEETFPSHFGTGTEDYYGYAWCNPEVFSHAYHNQPRCDGPENYGHTCVSRFHVLDNIPFRKAFRFDMEISHHIECTVSLAATSFWYATAGSSDSFSPLKAEDLRIQTPQPLQAPAPSGAKP